MKNRIITALIAGSVLVTGVPALSGCSQSTTVSGISDTLSLAERYLSELKYEQAIIEFDKVLNIDPKNADAYIGKADAYIAMGDNDSAIKTLQTGYDNTGDERIKAKLDELLALAGALSGEVTTTAGTTIAGTNATAEETAATEDNAPDGRVKVGNNTYSPDTEMISLWDINDEIAEQLLALKNLRSITFYRINDISSVKKLAPLESLSEITLYECYDLNDISAINSLNNLKKVEVSCSDPTQISKLGKYDDLTVVLQIKDITPQTISVLASCGNLTGVKQKGGYDDRLSNSQVELLTTLTQLKKLYIDTTADKLTDLNCMSSLNDLKELEVHLSRYYDSPKQDISTVMSMSGLEYLDISGHFDFPTNIGSLKKLKHLRITSSVDDHDDFSAIGLLTDLEYLEFDANYKDVDYSFLSGLKNLKSLTIDGTSANKLTPLTSLTNLESLSLTGALKRDYNDGIDLLKPLAQLKNLKSVDIYISGSSGDTNSNGWTSRFYAPLGEIKSLTSLTITDTGMADVDLSFISGLGNWFSDLRFRNMNITDLSFLSGKSVLNLEFYDTKIPTDITPILEMDWITCFITRNSGFSDEDINRIKEKFPNCYFMT